MKREKIILEYLKSGCSVLDIGSIGQTQAYSLWDILNKNKYHWFLLPLIFRQGMLAICQKIK